MTLNNNGGASISAGVDAAITGAITLFIALPLGVVLGCCGMRYKMRHGQGPLIKCLQKRMEQPAIYEEPLVTAIPVSANQAYGHINIKSEN